MEVVVDAVVVVGIVVVVDAPAVTEVLVEVDPMVQDHSPQPATPRATRSRTTAAHAPLSLRSAPIMPPPFPKYVRLRPRVHST